MPLGSPARISGSYELVTEAQDRDELARLAEQQAALRRVAMLVARGASPAEVFEAVVAEVGRQAPAEAAALSRFEDDGTLTVIGSWSGAGGYLPVGTRHPFQPGTLGSLVSETCRPGRVDSYADVPGSLAAVVRELGWQSSVGAPIVVDGRLWGVVAVASTTNRPLPTGTEERLAEFTELVATAIGNTESREELAWLAEEQAALRRVATLVARGAPSAEVFPAVAREVAHVMRLPMVAVLRYDGDGTSMRVMASCSDRPHAFQPGTRWPLDGPSMAERVLRTGRPARVEDYTDLPGSVASGSRESGLNQTAGAPIVVDARVWGVIATSSPDAPLRDGVEERLAEFTDLLATAIANAENRAELDASRARIVATADATRRRIERDLHDGAQQRLISLALEVRTAQTAVPPERRQERAELAHIADGLTSVLDELREIARGIHPAVLAEGGLGPALKSLARRSPVPVELELEADGRLPEPVEVAAYYVVSEALTNAAKHAQASVVRVAVEARAGVLRVVVRDDGLGGANPAGGSGLLGLKDRAEAIGGRFALRSLPGAGTSLHVELPLGVAS